MHTLHRYETPFAKADVYEVPIILANQSYAAVGPQHETYDEFGSIDL
jgi:hypothetical protein